MRFCIIALQRLVCVKFADDREKTQVRASCVNSSEFYVYGLCEQDFVII